MKKKFYILGIVIISILCLFDPSKVKATDNPTNKDFKIEDGILVKYLGSDKNVIVPDQVNIIGVGAFQYNKSMVTVSLPNSVTKIEDQAFEYCFKLKDVQFGNKLNYIGKWAFASCKELSSISPLNSVEFIGSQAFFNCHNLDDFGTMENVKVIGGNAFCLTAWLENKQKEAGLVIVNDVVINGAVCKGKLKIPNGVTKIADEAFAFAKELIYVDIPGSVILIGEGAFSQCTNLESVRMTDSVQTIGIAAFDGCPKLKNIRLSNSIKTFKDILFSRCNNLYNITIPQTIETISYTALSDCHGLKYITIDSGMKKETCEQLIRAMASVNENVKIFTNISKLDNIVKQYIIDNSVKLSDLRLTTNKLTLTRGKTFELRMNSHAKCTWKSSNPSIATVNHHGKITSKKKGTAIITATIFGTEYKCKVIVN